MSEENLEFKNEDIKIEEEKSFIKKYKKYSFISLLLFVFRKSPTFFQALGGILIIAISSTGLIMLSRIQKEKSITPTAIVEEKKEVKPILKETIEEEKKVEQKHFTIHTMDGKTFNGTIVKDAEDYLILNSSGKDIIISKDDIYKSTIK